MTLPAPHTSGATYSGTSLQLADDLTEAAWEAVGAQLGAIGRGIQWWLGDWVNFGQAKYSEKYTRAADLTGLDVQTLMNIAWVCSRIEASRRREILSFTHHAEVAALESVDQDRWLDRAERERMSTRALRAAIQAERLESHPVRELPAAVDEVSQKVAESIAEYRRQTGLSQRALAEELFGTPSQQGAVSRLENARHRPQIATAQRLALIAGIPVTEMGLHDAPVLPASVVQRAASAALAALDRGEVEAVRGILERLIGAGE